MSLVCWSITGICSLGEICNGGVRACACSCVNAWICIIPVIFYGCVTLLCFLFFGIFADSRLDLFACVGLISCIWLPGFSCRDFACLNFSLCVCRCVWVSELPRNITACYSVGRSRHLDSCVWMFQRKGYLFSLSYCIIYIFTVSFSYIFDLFKHWAPLQLCSQKNWE